MRSLEADAHVRRIDSSMIDYSAERDSGQRVMPDALFPVIDPNDSGCTHARLRPGSNAP
jgi:hypothetical protein